MTLPRASLEHQVIDDDDGDSEKTNGALCYLSVQPIQDVPLPAQAGRRKITSTVPQH